MTDTNILTGGLHFGEGPRWHQGRLWFSDFYDHAVKSVDPAGQVRTEYSFDDQTSGLGWLPDGRLLVVSMRQLAVLRQEGDRFVVHADLSGLARHLCNDMVVDGGGRAWVGNFGFDLDAELDRRGPEAVIADHPATNLVRVDPDGGVPVPAKAAEHHASYRLLLNQFGLHMGDRLSRSQYTGMDRKITRSDRSNE